MSGSEFPLTLLLQVQDDMSSQLAGIRSEISDLSTETDNLSNRVSSGGASFVSLGLGVASAASGVLNLVRQFHNLQRAQNTLTIGQNRAKNAQDAYNKAVKEHGKHSKEAEKASRNLENAQLRLHNQQVALSDRMTDFAFSVVPSVVGVVAGLAQVFQVTSGSRGIAGFGTSILKLGIPFAILGGALLAFKTNLFGFRDAINQIGFAIGQAIPALQPFLKFLSSVATLLDLQGGNKKAAKKFVNNFIGGLKEAFANVQEKIQKILSKAFSGDIGGAIKQITLTIKDIARHIIIDGTPLDQLPTRIKNHFMAAMAKHKGDVLTATADVLVFLGNIFFGTVTGGKTGKKMAFGDAVRAGIQARIDEAKGNPITLAINFNDFFNLQITPFDPVGNLTQGWADSFHKWWNTLVGNASTTLQGNIKGVMDIINGIATALHNLDVALGGGADQRWKTFVSIVTPAVSTAWLLLGAAFEVVKNGISFITQNAPTWWDAFVATVTPAVSTAWILLGAAFEVVKQGIQFLFDNAPTWWNAFITTVTPAVSTAWLLLGAAFEVVKSGISFVTSNAPTWWDAFVASVNSTVSAAWLVYGIAATAVGDAIKAIKGLSLPTWWNGFVAGITTAVADAWTKFSGAVDTVVTAVGKLIKLNPSKSILDFLTNIGKQLGLIPASLTLPIDTLSLQPKLIQIADIPGTGGGIGGKWASDTFMHFMDKPIPIDSITLQPQSVALDMSNNPQFSNIAFGNGGNGNIDFSGLTQQIASVALQISQLGNLWITTMNSMTATAQVDAQMIQTAFSPVFTNLSAGFTGLANTVSAIMNSFGANAQSGASQITAAFSSVFINLSAGFTGLANTVSVVMNSMGANARSGGVQILSAFNITLQALAKAFSMIASEWSTVCNSFGANAKSGASQIISAFKAADSAVTAAFKHMASAASSAFKVIISGANSATTAVKKLISTMNSIPNIKRTITITTVRKTINAAKGFSGIVTTPTTFNVGEGFKPELVTVQPLTGAGSAHITNQVTTKRKNGGGSPSNIIIQVFLDGKKVNGIINEMMVEGQGGYR